MATADLGKLKIDKQGGVTRKPRRRPFLWLGLVVVIILVVGLFFSGKLTPTVAVETATISLVYPSQTFTLLNASGYVVAQRKAAVAGKVTGRLEWLGVEEGSQVQEGQVLARLENRDVTAARDQAAASLVTARANVDQAKAELHDAERSFSRLQQLLSEGVVSQADFDGAEARYRRSKAAVVGAEAAVQTAAAALRGAEVALDYTQIRAPFDAVVLTKNADVGDIVTPLGAAANAKAAVVSIADLGSLRVEADVSESNLAKIKMGQPCEVTLDALPDTRFRGEVHTIVPTADRSKATVQVKVRFLDRDSRILPEMSAKVAFLERPVQAAEKQPRIAVSPTVVAERQGRKVLFVLRGDRVVATPVTLGPAIGDLVEVTSGVRAGEKIAVKPLDKLKDGSRVKVAEK